jgi:hypothetical protein
MKGLLQTSVGILSCAYLASLMAVDAILHLGRPYGAAGIFNGVFLLRAHIQDCHELTGLHQ